MLERPFITLRRSFKRNNAVHKESVKTVFEKSDNLSLWIIGISLGSISLFISNFKDLQTYLLPKDIKLILLLLFISSICGIVHRLLFIWYYILIDYAFRKIDADLSEKEHMDTENNLTGSETFLDLLILNNQFQDVTEYENKYKSSDQETQKNLYNELVVAYIRNTTWAKQNAISAIENIEKIYKENLGIKLNFKPKSAMTLKIIKYTSVALYIVFMLCFLFAFWYFYTVVHFPFK